MLESWMTDWSLCSKRCGFFGVPPCSDRAQLLSFVKRTITKKKIQPPKLYLGRNIIPVYPSFLVHDIKTIVLKTLGIFRNNEVGNKKH